jgi:hypothetical protein
MGIPPAELGQRLSAEEFHQLRALWLEGDLQT